MALESNQAIDDKFNWDLDFMKRAQRNRLRSKSSKNLNSRILMKKINPDDEMLKRNNSLTKKKVRCDMIKPLAKSR